MPRTQINYPPVRPKEADPASPGAPASDGTYVGDSTVHVVWMPAARGGHVQVALEVEQAYAELVLQHPNGESPSTTYLYSPPLDRADLNKMIRTLRQARDAAYGRDE